ncbi:MAG: amidophosphoribosyltransferase [Candidatus Dadabacteria bacterium]|nr:MAG: amidophosphoribosyltransferase [Candidatus Dadabacteria bacterium]
MFNRSDKFIEECGLIGIWNHPEAANLAYLGLYAQQHRGQEGAGVVALDNSKSKPLFSNHRGVGLVQDVFSNFDFQGRLPGKFAVGHVRYTTAGGHGVANVQPFYAEIASGELALAHNGNLINVRSLRRDLVSNGAILRTNSDTELFLHLMANQPATLPLLEQVIAALNKVKGAYSLIILFKDRMLAVRDPNGFRPLSLAKLGDGFAVASETCAFDLIGAEYIREIEPGEIVELMLDNEIKSYFPFKPVKASPCIFEYVYFARPDSFVFGRNVYPVRKNMGHELAREHPAQADIVIPVPDSGVPAAIGFAEESGIPLEMGLIRNHYVGRTFIEPKQSIRDFGVKIKLNANREVLEGKRVVVVDDSIVRGTTSRKLVKMLRAAGAAEVHMRISSPPTTDPCYYGIDTPEKNELIASSHSVTETAKYIGADSLAYLSIEGLYRAVGAKKCSMCDACFSGNYPVGTPAGDLKQEEMF